MSYFKEIIIKKEPFVFEHSSGEENPQSDGNENDEDDGDDDDDEPGSRCGEIFIRNKTQTWTFVCTFCDKSMRQIEDFINHIKHAHVNLPPPLPVELIESSHLNDDNNFNEANSDTEMHSDTRKQDFGQFNPLDRVMHEYVDYNDFLDVNVQTVPEVILSETNGRMEVSKEKDQAMDTSSATTSSNVERPLGSESADLPGIEPRNQRRQSYDRPVAIPEIRIKTEPGSENYDQQEHRESKPIPMQLTSSRSSGRIVQATVIPPKVKQRKQRKDRKAERLRRKQIKGPAYCQICKRTFQYHSLYRNHMVKHTSETPFVCTVCKKGFKSKQAIRYHMSTHQRQKPHQCELCQSGFYHEWQFVAHMETHRGENRHPCEVCGKVNRTKFDKDLHMRTHTGDRPFACEFCMKRFRLRHHLSNHLKLHLTYRCDHCRKQFSNGVPLKKPYTCPDCMGTDNKIQVVNSAENTYREEEDDQLEDSDENEDTKANIFELVNTSQSVEAINPNTCKVCKKTFVNKRGLGVHISTKHQNILY